LVGAFAEQREQLQHPVLHWCARPARCGQRSGAQVLLHREVLEDLTTLRNLHHAGPHDRRGLHPVEALAVELDRSRVDRTADEPERP
jgi:hypothetical protein